MNEDAYARITRQIIEINQAMKRARRRLQVQSFLLGAMGAYIIQGWIR